MSQSLQINRGPFFPAFRHVSGVASHTQQHFSVSVAEVSFYGDSYIHLQTVEASERTSLHLRFQTSSRAGLLFLALGSTDFLLLELISGHLQVNQTTAEAFHQNELGFLMLVIRLHS